MALRKVGGDVARRWLSPREQIRIGAVLMRGAYLVEERLGRGDRLRSDRFFDLATADRSHAEEVVESVLLTSQREPEERKLPYLAHLLANVAFDEHVSAEMAHQLIKGAEDITYRQLCILSMASGVDRFGLHSNDYRGQHHFAKDLYQVLYECLDLYNRAYINFGGEVVFGPTDIKPGAMQIQGMGADLFGLMELALIPDHDVMSVASHLR